MLRGMRRTLRRETLIGLRASQAAHRLAEDVLHPRMEVTSLPCRNCGNDVPIPTDVALPHHPDPERAWMYTRHAVPPRPAPKCPECGAAVSLPEKLEFNESTARTDTASTLNYGLPPDPIEVRWDGLVLVLLVLGAFVVGLLIL